MADAANMFIPEDEAERLRAYGYTDEDLKRVQEAREQIKYGEELRAMVAQDVMNRTQPKGALSQPGSQA